MLKYTGRLGVIATQWFAIGFLVISLNILNGRATAVLAYPCEIAWTASPDPTVGGYAVYYGVEGASVTNRIDVGTDCFVTLPDLLASADYFFYVVSYNTNGIESLPSNIVDYAPPALSAPDLKLLPDGSATVQFLAATDAACHVEFSPSLSPPQWQLLGAGTAGSDGQVTVTDTLGQAAERFYRVVEP